MERRALVRHLLPHRRHLGHRRPQGPRRRRLAALSLATYATRSDGEVLDHLDLLIDFIPVIHVPNTVPPAEEHWGQSSLAKVLQVFDELAGSDTDSARASATTGLPMLAISGANPQRKCRPGPAWSSNWRTTAA
ncbi:hypothetical protein [Streptomyces sp. Wb2n-11]|uniref:hypothetical protein n=1 Tax=Streptomyces sp. Wb2n-11 TaxID=1030533 RepID=UPI000B0760D3|nr:hypothetical protein [Streptomyces sp. Wb2n-11]